MRSLTEAEARVIRALMADPFAPERRLLEVARVPRTTSQTVRHRAFVNGWLEERFVPNPALLGVGQIRFFLAQPFTEHWSEVVRKLRSLDHLVVLWAWPETLFGVFFEGSISRDWNEVATRDSFRRSWSVSSESQSGGVVAYFDFEGAWSRWTLGESPLAYPRGLPSSRLRLAPQSKAVWTSVRELMLNSTITGPFASKASVFRPGGLSRHGRKLLSSGWFSPLILPNLTEIPAVRGYRPSRVVFVTATPIPGSNPRQLFEDLAGKVGMSPFVFAYDAGRVIFATLSPVPPQIERAQGLVLSLLQNHVTKVEVIREPIDALFPAVNHRYDRLTTMFPPQRRETGNLAQG